MSRSWYFVPSFPQLIPNLPRSAQVIYPKDIGPILLWADIFPGARVRRSGGWRRRSEHGAVARYWRDRAVDLIRNSRRLSPSWREKMSFAIWGRHRTGLLKLGDVASDLTETEIDRIVLDLPEPWQRGRTRLERPQARRLSAFLFAHRFASQEPGRCIAR